MDTQHLIQMAQVARVLTDERTIVVAGIAAAFKCIDVPDDRFQSLFEQSDEVIFFICPKVDADGVCALSNLMIGRDSPYHRLTECCANVEFTWNAELPNGWVNRLRYFSFPGMLRSGVHIMLISQHDFLLDQLRKESEHAMLYAELLIGDEIEIHELRPIVDEWDIDAKTRRRIKKVIDSLRTIKNRKNRLCDK